MPFVAAVQVIALKLFEVQVRPKLSSSGIVTRPTVPVLIAVWEKGWAPKPKDTSGICAGYVGENCVAMLPSGRTRARYSPAASSLKFVCSAAPGVRRLRSEANTMRCCRGGRFVAGNCHLASLLEESVRYQPARFTFVAPAL